MTDPEHVREIGKQSFTKRKEENPEHIKEISEKSFRKWKAENPEHIRDKLKQNREQKIHNTCVANKQIKLLK